MNIYYLYLPIVNSNLTSVFQRFQYEQLKGNLNNIEFQYLRLLI